METGWVIESCESQPYAPLYWTGGYYNHGLGTWSCDHNAAVRFARERDARQVLEASRDVMEHRVAEHIWDDGNRAETVFTAPDPQPEDHNCPECGDVIHSKALGVVGADCSCADKR
jgi:hypothetical protein